MHALPSLWFASLNTLFWFANLSEASVHANTSLLWGPYRPNLYVGIKPRIPQSLLFGLMWASADDTQRITGTLRHTCEQDEAVASYGWTSYDTRNGGKHVVNDTENHLDLTTWFVKNPAIEHGWSLRVQGKPRPGAQRREKTTVIFYIGAEDPNATIECMDLSNIDSISANAICQGVSTTFNGFRLTLKNDHSGKESSTATQVFSLNVDPGTIWQAKSIFVEQTSSGLEDQILAGTASRYNLQYLQQTLHGPFEFDITFTTNSSQHGEENNSISQTIEQSKRIFKERFNAVYGLQAPFQDSGHQIFSQSLLSNLLGGIGYFYGTSEAADSLSTDSVPAMKKIESTATEQKPHGLFSAVPSRSFFPRGFLWDEGFHLQIVLDWDLDLAMEIATSWFDTMNEDGWIAREQILGAEASSKVPPQFHTQYRDHANPPTLFLVVQAFLKILVDTSSYHGTESQLLVDDGRLGKALLKDLYPKMKTYYNWFRHMQAGSLQQYQASFGVSSSEGYRWRGQTTRHILPSGLDDYPRASPQHEQDLHVDALAWVGSMTVVLQEIATFFKEDGDYDRFAIHKVEIMHSLDGIHWSDADRTYCDMTLSASSVPKHVCHKGYVSILPFAIGLLDLKNPHLGSSLDVIEDPNQLWSPHGLRSLSVSDPYYGKDENYWRGPIWVNINYMVIQRLYELATNRDSNTHQKRSARLYNELRRNLIDTVFRSWQETGFAWEQYADDTGKGQRTRHFTGWTSLVVRIMAMPELDSAPGTAPLDHGSAADHVSGEANRPVSVYSYLYDGDASGWRSLLVVITLVMLTFAVVFRRKFMVLWKRRA